MPTPEIGLSRIPRSRALVPSRAGRAAVAPAGCFCSGNGYNCGDFPSHSAAQACYEYRLDVAGYDIHRLDGDDDGEE